MKPPKDYSPDDLFAQIYDEEEHDKWTLRICAIIATLTALAIGFGFVALMGWW